MNALQTQALKKAGQLRTKLKRDLFTAVNIYDVCAELGITVRFIDVSLEGMYVNLEGAVSQTILISSMRPMPRRVYTCAHELGHHIFGHGSRIDGLTEEITGSSVYDRDEYLVDAFAGAFLMPIAGIEAEFIKRKWNINDASSLEFFNISSVFGIGYSTLIKHCKANKLIDETHAAGLLKQSPKNLLMTIMRTAVTNSHFKIIDGKTNLSIVDIEVGNYLFLPADISVEGDHLFKLQHTDSGYAYIAKRSGIVRASTRSGDSGFFIRIQNSGYIGLAENRHLEY